MVGQVDDLALGRSIDGAVWFVDKTLQAFGMPMVAARLPLVAIHALLNDRPFALVGHEETMQVKVEAVLYRGAVDFSHEAAGPRQGQPVNTDAFAGCCQFLRRAARMLAAATADMNAKLALQRGEPAFQRADDARGDPRRVPVHSHASANCWRSVSPAIWVAWDARPPIGPWSRAQAAGSTVFGSRADWTRRQIGRRSRTTAGGRRRRR